MKDTPRTDEMERAASRFIQTDYVVAVSFARELERENAELLVKLSLIQCPHCKMVYDHRPTTCAPQATRREQTPTQ